MKNPRTMLQVSAVLAIVVIAACAWIMRERRLRNRSEADVIQRVEAETEAPDALLAEGTVDFTATQSLDLSAQAMENARSMQGRLTYCTDQWADTPDTVRIWVEADAAGRLTRFAVQDTPDDAQQCLLDALKRARWPRNARGATDLPLRY